MDSTNIIPIVVHRTTSKLYQEESRPNKLNNNSSFFQGYLKANPDVRSINTGASTKICSENIITDFDEDPFGYTLEEPKSFIPIKFTNSKAIGPNLFPPSIHSSKSLIQYRKNYNESIQ